VLASVPEIHVLTETIETWQAPMVLAITTGLSNARSEGYNRIVKHVGLNAFGFRNPTNQRRRVRWACTRQSRQGATQARQLHPRSLMRPAARWRNLLC
jgi:transposase